MLVGVSYNFLVIILSSIVSLGMFLIFWITNQDLIMGNIRKVSNKFVNRVYQAVSQNTQKNKFLFKDRINIDRTLAITPIRIKGKPINFQSFVRFSFILGIIGFLVAFVTTSRILIKPALSNSPKIANTLNIPTMLIGFVIGFVIPRWLIIIFDGRVKKKIAQETPQAIAKIADFSRLHANLERAVYECIPELPRATRKVFERAWDDRLDGVYPNFTAMIFDISRQVRNQIWSDFAHICLVDTTLGSSDRLAKIRSLQTRARKSLLASKVERKSLNAKTLKVTIGHVFLILIWAFEVFVKPEFGYYLYTTSVGKVLLMSVYITFAVNIALFTYLYYNN